MHHHHHHHHYPTPFQDEVSGSLSRVSNYGGFQRSAIVGCPVNVRGSWKMEKGEFFHGRLPLHGSYV